MRASYIILLIGLPHVGLSQNKENFIRTEFEKIKVIPSSSQKNMFGELKAMTVFDSSFFAIVKLGPSAIPGLIKTLTDPSVVSIMNPCWEEEQMKRHDIAWFLISEIEPFPMYEVFKIQFCTSDQCDHFPQGFFNFIHSDPLRFANLYKRYFYSRERKKYLKRKNQRR